MGVKTAIKLLDNEEVESFLEKNGASENYIRNRQLIDFRQIPENVQQEIVDTYKNYKKQDVNLNRLFDSYNWPSLMAIAQDINSIFLTKNK